MDDNTYRTRDLVARRAMFYDGAHLEVGDRFRPLSQVDADYLLSRQRADLAAEAPQQEPAPELQPAAPVPARRVARRRAAPDAPTDEQSGPSDDTAGTFQGTLG